MQHSQHNCCPQGDSYLGEIKVNMKSLVMGVALHDLHRQYHVTLGCCNCNMKLNKDAMNEKYIRSTKIILKSSHLI